MRRYCDIWTHSRMLSQNFFSDQEFIGIYNLICKLSSEEESCAKEIDEFVNGCNYYLGM